MFLVLFRPKFLNTFNYCFCGVCLMVKVMCETGDEKVQACLKKLVEQGFVLQAGLLQGFAFYMHGVVVEGNRIGRTMGYPTANLKMSPGLLAPAQGVYAAFVRVHTQWFESMVNIGIRPTLDQHNVTVEAHIFGFDENIYGQNIEIHFINRIRDEMRFPSLEALKEQLHSDHLESRAVIKKLSLKPDLNDRVVYFNWNNSAVTGTLQ